MRADPTNKHTTKPKKRNQDQEDKKQKNHKKPGTGKTAKNNGSPFGRNKK